MVQHFTPAERDEARRLAGEKKTPIEIWANLKALRARRHVPPPDLTSVRRLLRGKTFKESVEEARGRRAKLSRRAVLAMDKKRKELQAKAAGEYEVHWKDIIKKARVGQVHASTAARAFAREGIGVQWRAPRVQPLRGPEHVRERL